MATGERRLGSSARRGMTVLGKIPAVPKPINLPSQRLENRGLDPSVEIVPRGTFSWGTGRSPPASGSSWGNVGLSSSPPVSTGAWNTASTSAQPVSGSNNITGSLAQTPPRPLSAGSTRPLSAGATRPSSASVASGRAWGAAAKLEEQLQPSRFNLTTVDFPTLGSEKNPNLRPQQNTSSSNRPTSADATKERHVAYTGTSFSRPTSADGSKERKMGYPGVAPSDRPTSADGTLVDRGRHQSDMRLRASPPFADGNLSDEKHPVYTGVVGHGTAGPGPGPHGQLKDSHSVYPPLAQQGIASPGSQLLPTGEIMYPGASQHDQYFNRHQAPHSNTGERDMLVLPMDTRAGMYGSYPSDSGPNHLDRSKVYQSHHPQSSWEPNDFDRPRVYQSHHLQSGSSEHLRHGMVQIEPRTYGMETAMQHEQPVVGNRRDGYNTSNNVFGDQRGGWAGRNVVYIGSPIDARDLSISTSGIGRDLQKPDIFITSWGDQPTHSGWGNVYNGDTSMGMYRGGASSVMYRQAPFLEKMPQGSVSEGASENRHMKESQGKGAGHVSETPHSISSQGFGHDNQGGGIQLDSSVFPLGASVTGKASKLPGSGVTGISNSLRQDVRYHKQEKTARILASKTMIGGPEFSEMGKNTLDNGSPGGGSGIWPPGSGASVETQPSMTKQEDEVTMAEQSKEPERTEFVSDVTIQSQQDNHHDNLQGKNNVHMVDKDSTNGLVGAAKSTIPKKRFSISKGKRKDDVPPSPSLESEETTRASKTPVSKASDGNSVNGSTSTSAVFSTSGKECNSDASSGVPVTFDTARQASADTCSNGAHGTVQAKSSTHTQFEDYSAGDLKAMPTPKPAFSVSPVGETVAVASSEEGGQAPNDNGSNMKTRQNAYPSRRPHYSRSMHESHSADKQHVNHGMIWAPVKNSTTVGATKEEDPPHLGKAGKMQESSQQMSTEVNQEQPMQPLQEHQPKESVGQSHAQQVQQMQSAASSQQGQGHQMQEHSVVNEMQVQQMQRQKVEKQGQRTQHQRPRSSAHKEPEQWTQQEQFIVKNQSLGTKQQQSVVSSYLEQGQLQSQFAASSEREVHLKKEILPTREQQEKAGANRPVPVADRFEGKRDKDESTIYTARPARNQQHQRREQEYDQKFSASSHHGQRFLNKGDRIVKEDQENQPSETLALPVAESNSSKDEVKSHSSRTSKHQKRRQHESSASLNAGDRHVSMLEPSLVAEPEAIKEEAESRPYNRKLVKQHEMQNKQSAAVSHQEVNLIGEGQKKPFVQNPDSSSCGSSTIKNERKFYVPKQARQQYMHQQEDATSGYEGQRSQEQTSQEAHLLNEKVQQSPRLSGVESNVTQSSRLSGVESNVPLSSQLSGAESNVRKDDIELYTPKPARQQNMQGHQTARGQRRQRIADLAEGQCGLDATSSSTQAGIESALNKDKEITRHDRVSDSMEHKGVAQSCVTGNRNESKLHVSSEFCQSKQEVKYYTPKSGRQQQLQQHQSVLNIDHTHKEVPMREGTLPQEKWERYHQMSGTEQIKRKDEIKLYKPKPRQQKSTEPLAVLEGKAVKETEQLLLPEEREQQRSGNDERTREFEHGYKNRNHSTKPHKSASFPRSQMNTQPSVEDGTVGGHVSRVDETSAEVISKEHSKNRESGFHQRIGSRQKHYDVGTVEEAEVSKPKQYQKWQYHYQPVAQQPQTVKSRQEKFNVDYEHKLSTRQPDQGQNRYERREGPSRRGRLHGYGYRAADHTG